MSSYTFTIPGDPLLIGRARMRQNKWMDASEEIKLYWRSILRKQMNDGPMLKKSPISMTGQFYFPFLSSLNSTRKSLYEGRDHIEIPTITKLLSIIGILSEGIVYECDCSISQVMANKFYSQDPRSVVTFESRFI